MSAQFIVPVLVGPTASGKTAISLLLAERFPLEIISADSRQIYKYMDIGTAKVSESIRKRIIHHLIDICDPDEVYSAGKFGLQARALVNEIAARGNQPLVVGGSGFYIRSFLDGICEIEAADESTRQALRERLQSSGIAALYRELAEIDAVYAQKISSNDSQRILRALEVYQITGKPFSQWHRQTPNPAPFKYLLLGLDAPRPYLYERINQRVDEMLQTGLVDEVRMLREKGYTPEMNALNTVGYKEVFQYIEGKISLEAMIDLIKRNSRRYAKRQMTWFRKDARIQWRQVNSGADLEKIADEIYTLIRIKQK
jgi:tRNA dimethylallyltransferase